MANEFREAAEALWRETKGLYRADMPLDVEDQASVEIVDRAMELTFKATREFDNNPLTHESRAAKLVAARVKGRIESE